MLERPDGVGRVGFEHEKGLRCPLPRLGDQRVERQGALAVDASGELAADAAILCSLDSTHAWSLLSRPDF